jgi:hypothetical protein
VFEKKKNFKNPKKKQNYKGVGQSVEEGKTDFVLT